MTRWRGLIEEYRKFLPVTDRTPVVTLCEGNTPLIRATRLAQQIAPGIDLYLKIEGANPTGSFKDRGMTLAISKAVEAGVKAVICASTGNTSASAAAYGARAGLAVYVLIPAGKIAMGKLSQAMMHQATVIQIQGNFDQAFTIVKELSVSHHIELVNSLNPYRIEGQKTAAMEVCDQLGDAPTIHVLPVGNAGNITAYWKGYQEYRAANQSTKLPRMIGFQATGAAPIVLGHIVENPQTVPRRSGSAILPVGKPPLNAVKESSGAIDSVTDEEILQAYRMLAATEGVFCEPSSAASVVSLTKLSKQGGLREGETVVCTLTGHGLKDADTAISVSAQPKTVRATREDVARLLRV